MLALYCKTYFMTHAYAVEGMTCEKCVAKVKSELLKIGDVSEAKVQLTAPQAIITMQRHVPLPVLQNAISKAGIYIISESDHPAHPEETIDEPAMKTYWPLILVFIFIIGISVVASFRNGGFNLMPWMNYFMGGFFIAFSFFKFLDIKGFADSYSTYDLLAVRVRSYGFVYPFIELALGLAYITVFAPVVTNIVTIIVMGFSSLGPIRSVMQKRKIQCACLGAVFKLPMSTVTILEDLLMVAMAVLMILIFY